MVKTFGNHFLGIGLLELAICIVVIRALCYSIAGLLCLVVCVKITCPVWAVRTAHQMSRRYICAQLNGWMLCQLFALGLCASTSTSSGSIKSLTSCLTWGTNGRHCGALRGCNAIFCRSVFWYSAFYFVIFNALLIARPLEDLRSLRLDGLLLVWHLADVLTDGVLWRCQCSSRGVPGAIDMLKQLCHWFAGVTSPERNVTLVKKWTQHPVS